MEQKQNYVMMANIYFGVSIILSLIFGIVPTLTSITSYIPYTVVNGIFLFILVNNMKNNNINSFKTTSLNLYRINIGMIILMTVILIITVYILGMIDMIAKNIFKFSKFGEVNISIIVYSLINIFSLYVQGRVNLKLHKLAINKMNVNENHVNENQVIENQVNKKEILNNINIKKLIIILGGSTLLINLSAFNTEYSYYSNFALVCLVVSIVCYVLGYVSVAKWLNNFEYKKWEVIILLNKRFK